MDSSHNGGASYALYHPYLHGPADHGCHNQQKGTQTQGTFLLSYRLQMSCIISCWTASKQLNFNFINRYLPSLERLWISSRSVHGWGYARCLLFDGVAMVCSSHRPLHHPRQQPETWIRVLSSRGAAQVPWYQRATLYRAHDLCSYGVLGLHDISAQGETLVWTHSAVMITVLLNVTWVTKMLTVLYRYFQRLKAFETYTGFCVYT